MKCPFCGAVDSQVIETRIAEHEDAIRRRRKCSGCDKRFTTFETVELRLPQVVKANNTRSEFSVEKLRASMTKALHKRFVATEYVDQAIARITQAAASSGEREISSRAIGELVMTELKQLDKVGYIRFASVYKQFSDVAEFTSAVIEVNKKSKAKN
jgi:transcriptional repressor NrdR